MRGYWPQQTDDTTGISEYLNRLSKYVVSSTLEDPGYAKASMNFAVRPLGDGSSLLATETRVEATDDATRLRFGAYWRLIYPGSALIRVNWLDAIRRRAEAAPALRP